MRTIGTRVGAILSADETSVKLLGYGSFAGKEVPPTGWLHDANIPNPKMQLDNGSVVWGYQCYWGGEEAVKKMIGDRKIVDVTIEDEEVTP